MTADGRGVFLIAAVGAALLLCGCRETRVVERELTPPEYYPTLNEESPFLKAHMEDGRVYVLAEWTVEEAAQMVSGTGHLLGINRDTLDQGFFELSIGDVAIFETNVLETSGSVAALAIITGISLAATGLCIANPKACFGSCPTFYAAGDTLLQAEGFSSSIAPSLEQRDIDALYRIPHEPEAEAESRSFQLRMTNEALETHVVRRADLLLAARPEGGRVFAGIKGAFLPADVLHAPNTCRAPEGNCLADVRALDGSERFSRADSTYLAAKEYLHLTFPTSSSASLGLVIGARQTLLSTFLLYQTLAYMGRDAGEWFAMVERRDDDVRSRNLGGILGGIEVLVQDADSTWISAGKIEEHGPLATDVHVVPLPSRIGSDVRVKLRMAKGAWRIDYLALAELGAPVRPVRVRPSAVHKNGAPDEQALAALLDSAKTLTTFPGDEYTLTYRLPEHPEAYELFLETEGYYLEWMRQEWLDETNRPRVSKMLSTPDEMLRILAPVFKKIEPSMERTFWNSRYER